MKLPLQQFTIGSLMSVVLLTALGLAGLRNPTPIWASAVFTLAVSLLCLAVLGAVFRSAESRPFLTGFALFGWVYLILARRGRAQPTIIPKTEATNGGHRRRTWERLATRSGAIVDDLRRLAAHESRLKRTYERAARHPWLLVEPDPPEPEL
jgi:hypothetical protein